MHDVRSRITPVAHIIIAAGVRGTIGNARKVAKSMSMHPFIDPLWGLPFGDFPNPVCLPDLLRSHIISFIGGPAHINDFTVSLHTALRITVGGGVLTYHATPPSAICSCLVR